MPFFVTEALPMLIIVGGAVGGGCVLLICVITLVSLCCRHTGKGELNGQYGQEGQQPIPLHTSHIQVCSRAQSRLTRSSLIRNWCQAVWKQSLSCFQIPSGKRCTRLSKSDIRVQIVHSDHNAPRGNDDEEDVKEPMVSVLADCTWATVLGWLGSLFGSRSGSSDMLGVPSGSQQQ